ncbi:hypothetical protein Y032_0024g958 [Ancylostoma ceylanicum]|uniref:Uncharacterized protein n=1 Tax=Ancylostoma ceylanicum TaxID=53326 RepID=A0A016UYR5_9BILA|nr:hypothetical protein Y032_0024g958 [Ancylostoma ceylanicum]
MLPHPCHTVGPASKRLHTLGVGASLSQRWTRLPPLWASTHPHHSLLHFGRRHTLIISVDPSPRVSPLLLRRSSVPSLGRWYDFSLLFSSDAFLLNQWTRRHPFVAFYMISKSPSLTIVEFRDR